MQTVVGHIMTRGVTTVGLDQTLADVQAIFQAARFHHLVVEGDDGRVAGVISDHDLLLNVSPFVGKLAERPADLASLQRRVHQVMSRRLVTCRERSLAVDAARVMLERKVGCMPVVDWHRRCVGIITLHDMIAWSIAVMDREINNITIPRAA